MEVSGDEIADVVLKQFESWEKKRGPQLRTNGVREWVPLSGIVAQGKPLRDLVQIFILTLLYRKEWVYLCSFCV
jgi:hypothetical protein